MARIKFCSNCGTRFVYRGRHGTRNKNFYCSNACYISDKTKKKEVMCDCCGKKFLKKRSDIWRSNHNFCSQECNLQFRHEEGKRSWSHRENGQVTYRAMVEQQIGRTLESYEEIHHIDGNHFNNSHENLIVLSKSEHSKIHAARKRRGTDGRFIKSRTIT